MKFLSASSTNPDSYEAGRELGNVLAAVEPEAIVIFSAIHYDFGEQYSGLTDGLGREVTVFGATSDGFVETHDASDVGVAALAISSNGRAQFTPTLVEGLSTGAEEAFTRAAEELHRLAPAPLRYAFLSTALGTDGALAARVFSERLGVPFSGGIAGDDRVFKRGMVLLNGKAYPNSVGLLGMSGDFTFSIGAASGWNPLGSLGKVTAAEGTTVSHIDGEPATHWITKQLGREATSNDLGILSFMEQRPNGFVMRSIAVWDDSAGTVSAFGAIPKGNNVQLATANRQSVLKATQTALDRAKGVKPQAALLVSCAGRKWLLGDEFIQERNAILGILGQDTPLIGFPSMGEFGPLSSQDPKCEFHNVTCVVSLFGEA